MARSNHGASSSEHDHAARKVEYKRMTTFAPMVTAKMMARMVIEAALRSMVTTATPFAAAFLLPPSCPSFILVSFHPVFAGLFFSAGLNRAGSEGNVGESMGATGSCAGGFCSSCFDTFSIVAVSVMVSTFSCSEICD